MDLFNKIFGKIEHIFFQPWLNPFATFYVNFRLCRYKDAIKMPIYIYGKAYFDVLKGSILFNNKVSTGMITFGRIRGHFTAPKGSVYFFMEEKSNIVFNGNCSFSIDSSLRLTKNATIIFGDNVRIGDAVKIMCENRIEIGSNSEITFGSQIVDTNFHYIQDIVNNKIKRKNLSIKLGSNNWIGNNSTIMKGAETHDCTILASGSLLNKKFEEKNIVLAGSPAKIVDRNKKRIYSIEMEKEIDEFFYENENVDYYVVKISDNDEDKEDSNKDL